jgi:NADH-quinone oxidoreductase subunit N
MTPLLATVEGADQILDKLAMLWPELTLLIGACICLITGLSPSLMWRRATVGVAAVSLIIAAILVAVLGLDELQPLGFAGMTPFLKLAVCGMGLILLVVATGVPGRLKQSREADEPGRFDPGNALRGEFFAFMLLSLAGVMMTAGASDLVWLFLALELTSLPTYVLVACGRDRVVAQESGVKYFFLGAMSAAVFLYGFALIYGATGYTDFESIRAFVVSRGGEGNLPPLLLLGVVLSILGLCFKVAAVPMHFYAADVYEGANTSVTAFLAFVPKTAGFTAIILVLGLIGWDYGPRADRLPEALVYLIATLSVLTMTIGNVLGLRQANIKRTLAYSSVAHSGYILMGVLAGPGVVTAVTGEATGSALSSGLGAVLFYLIAYGLGTIGSFAVLGCLHTTTQGHRMEVHTYEELGGLRKSYPSLAGIMLVSVLSLMGLPPLVGFLGKFYLINPLIHAGYWPLVIILVLNSAISAGYYLRIAAACFFGEPDPGVVSARTPYRHAGAFIAALLTVIIGFHPTELVDWARDAVTRDEPVAVELDDEVEPVDVESAAS